MTGNSFICILKALHYILKVPLTNASNPIPIKVKIVLSSTILTRKHPDCMHSTLKFEQLTETHVTCQKLLYYMAEDVSALSFITKIKTLQLTCMQLVLFRHIKMSNLNI